MFSNHEIYKNKRSDTPMISILVVSSCLIASILINAAGVKKMDKKVIECHPSEAEDRVKDALDEMYPGDYWDGGTLRIVIEKANAKS